MADLSSSLPGTPPSAGCSHPGLPDLKAFAFRATIPMASCPFLPDPSAPIGPSPDPCLGLLSPPEGKLKGTGTFSLGSELQDRAGVPLAKQAPTDYLRK